MNTTEESGTLAIRVEPMAGSGIKEIFKDAVILANRLGVTVLFDANMIQCCAVPGTDWKLVYALWESQLNKKQKNLVTGPTKEQEDDSLRVVVGGGSWTVTVDSKANVSVLNYGVKSRICDELVCALSNEIVLVHEQLSKSNHDQ